MLSDKNETECQYGLSCDRQFSDSDASDNIKPFLAPALATFFLSMISVLVFPNNQSYLVALWITSALVLAFLINMPTSQKILKYARDRHNDFFWEIYVVIVMAALTFFGTMLSSVFQSIIQAFGQTR